MGSPLLGFRDLGYAAPFEPGKFQDKYEERFKELLAAELAGKGGRSGGLIGEAWQQGRQEAG